MRRLRLVLVSVVLAAASAGGVTTGGVSAAAAVAAVEPAARFEPPVDGPVVDPWRAPAGPFGPGNRGVDYETAVGAPVRASAPGVVTFAGRVGGGTHVVVAHDGGIRTSYSFLAGVLVRRGDEVAAGQLVGTSAGRIHFGVRVGDEYVDPAGLLGRARRFRLVPEDGTRPLPLADEVRGLLAGLGRATADVADRLADAPDRVAGAAAELVTRTAAAVADEIAALVHAAELVLHYTNLPGLALRLGERAMLYRAAQADCTPAGRPPPARPGGRRIVVLVAGFGSSSAAGAPPAVLDVDTRALGYADADVAVFSYAGGQLPGTRAVAGVPTSDYDAGDSTGDLVVAAARLRALLEAVRAAHPGVPVDVVAHSQGGVVARAALGGDADHFDPRLPVVANLVTLGSPHQGAAVATAAAALAASNTGSLVEGTVGRLAGPALDPGSTAAGQLDQTSPFTRELAERRRHPGARVTAIAAEGDVVVPALSSALAGATNVLVPVRGATAHDRLPGSPAAGREVALALAGAPPTCRDLAGGLAFAGAVDVGEHAVGGLLGTGAAWLDRWLGRRAEAPPR